jgi:streptogramin lyase
MTPVALLIDEHGNLWTFDGTGLFGGSEPVKLTAAGKMVGAFGSFGLGTTGMQLDLNGDLWITSSRDQMGGPGAVTVLNSDGHLIKYIYNTNTPRAQLNSPGGLAIDGHGNVWVANYRGNSVTELDSEGAAVANFDNRNRPGAEFDRPHRVAMDPSGDIWVLNEHSLTKLSGSGSLIGQFPIHGPQSVGRALAVDQSGRVWVADQDGVAVLSPTGKPLVHYDNSNAPGASFRAPDAIAILGDSAWIANGRAGSITKIAAAGMGSEFFPYGGPARTTGPQWPTAR